MNGHEHQLSNDKYAELLYRALTEIRASAWNGGDTDRIGMLADIVHNIPHYMVGSDDFALPGLRESFVEYAQRYWPETDPNETYFVRIIDMDEEEFRMTYRPTSWGWPQPQPVAAAG